MNQDFKEFFKSLNARGVEFLVLGGVAYNFYAPPRATKDIDVWIRPTVENATAFLAALAEFGFAHELDAGELVEKDKVLILGRAPNRIDVLTRPDGIEWGACWNRRVPSDYAGEPIAFLALEDLVASKVAAARDQDLVDVKKLRAIADKLRDKKRT
jgi:predicted nucleotidyltransferase